MRRIILTVRRCAGSSASVSFLLLLLAVPAGTAWSQADVIRDIAVRGTVHAEPQEILAQVHTRVGDRLTDRSTAVRIRRDIHRIISLGFVNDVLVAYQPLPDGVNLFFVVEERPVIREVLFEGADKIKPKRLLEVIGWDAKQRNFYSTRTVADYVLAVEREYGAKGFPATQVTTFVDEVSASEVVLHVRVIEGKKWKIERIEFAGNVAFREKELRKQLQTKPRFLWVMRNKYDESKFETDLALLRQYYENAGYLDVKVERGEFDEHEGGLILRIAIEEGGRYTAKPLALRGNTLFSDAEIAEVIATESGEVFRQWDYLRDDRRRVQELYEAQGFLEASVRADIVERDPEALVARPVIDIYEGNRIYLGHVIIRGVAATGEVVEGQPVYEDTELKTKRYVIRREIGLERGDVFDWTKVKEADRQLSRLGYFKRIEFGDPRFGAARQRGLFLDPGFAAPIPTDDPEVYDLLAELEEVRAGQIGLGAGYSTASGASVFASLEEPNLYGRGQNLSLSAMLAERGTSLRFGLHEPHFRQSEYSLGWEVYSLARESYGGRAFDEDRYGTSLRVGRRLWPDTRVYSEVRIESIDIDAFSSAMRFVELPDVWPDDRTATLGLAAGIVRDTRDSIERPSRGHMVRLDLEVGTPIADNEFVKGFFDGTWYRPLSEKLVLSYRGRLGMAAGYGDTSELPIFERYFVGGATTVRGFEEDAIGPYDLVREDDISGPLYGYQRNEKVFIGGETLILNNLELHYPLSEIFEGVVFVDAGSVWRDAGEIDLGEFRYGTGVGLRIKLPIGATAGLDVGIPFNDMDADETRTVHFRFSQSFR